MKKPRRTTFDPETIIVAASAIEERAHTMHSAHTIMYSNIQKQQRKRRWTGTRDQKRIYLQLLQMAKSMRAEAQEAMQMRLELEEKG